MALKFDRPDSMAKLEKEATMATELLERQRLGERVNHEIGWWEVGIAVNQLGSSRRVDVALYMRSSGLRGPRGGYSIDRLVTLGEIVDRFEGLRVDDHRITCSHYEDLINYGVPDALAPVALGLSIEFELPSHVAAREIIKSILRVGWSVDPDGRVTLRPMPEWGLDGPSTFEARRDHIQGSLC